MSRSDPGADEERSAGRSLLGDVDATASLLGTGAATLLAILIYLGSGNLLNFDAALIGYATATVFLAFGVTYRYVVWIRTPPTRRYLWRGWKAFLSFKNFRRFPTLVPRSVLQYLTFQHFIKERGTGRWLAHQAIFWGVVGATLITFPLTFGWIHFRWDQGTESGYVMFVFGRRIFSFDSLSFLGWMTFHALDVTAVLVIAGASYYLWRRFRNREAMTNQSFGHDFFPLIALIVISVTGLMLTFSSVLLQGRYYDFLALIHMAAVVLTLVYIPFGKFFHVVQRPASVGVRVYKHVGAAETGTFSCVRCGAPFESLGYVADLKSSMTELGLHYEDWIETCPRCKRLERGSAYRTRVKEGFR